MLLCPRCFDLLTETLSDGVAEFTCRECGGRAVTLPALERSHARPVLDALWPAARETARPDALHCPACSDGMGRASLVDGENAQEVVACGRCRIVWRDGAAAETVRSSSASPSGTESSALPPRPPSLPTPSSNAAPSSRVGSSRTATLPPAGTSGPARAPVVPGTRVLKAKKMDGDTVDVDLDGTDVIAAVAGLISKSNAPQRVLRPYITWALAISFLALVVLPAIGDLASHGLGEMGATVSDWIAHWGFLPAEPFRRGGLTFFTSFFLHAGLIHALGNVYFLVLAGEDLEGLLGRARFVGLLLAATLFGDLLDLASRTLRDIPAVGASGGVSGLLAYYALALPEVKVGVPFVFWGYGSGGLRVVRWIIPVRWMLAIWLGFQVLGALFGGVGIGYAAHLGGAAVGIGWWLIERQRAAAATPDAARTPPAGR